MEKDANHGVLFSRIRGLVVMVLVRLALTLHLFMLLFFFEAVIYLLKVIHRYPLIRLLNYF